MPIALETPIEIPAIPAETVSLRWIQSVTIVADGPAVESSAMITYRPMRNDGSLLPESHTVAVAELFRCCREVSEAQAVMDALLAAVIPIENWLKSQGEK